MADGPARVPGLRSLRAYGYDPGADDAMHLQLVGHDGQDQPTDS